MARFSLLFLVLAHFSAGALIICGDPQEDLKRAKFYRDRLKALAEMEGDLVGEDILYLKDMHGDDEPGSPFDFTADAVHQLRFLIGSCEVSPVRLGFGLKWENSLNFLERRANRHLLEQRKKVLAQTHYTQISDLESELAEVSSIQEQIGLKPGLNESKTGALKTEILKYANERRQVAQQISSKESCTPKDFRAKLPPVRNQGSAGLCFAYAAADLASFKTGKDVSPVGIAIAYYKDIYRSETEKSWGQWLMEGSNPEKLDLIDGGGNLAQGFMSAKRNGMCLDKDFGKTSHHTLTSFEDKEDIWARGEFSTAELDLLKEVEKLAATSDVTGKMEKIEKMKDIKSCSQSGQALKTLFPSVNISDLTEVINESTEETAIFNTYDRFCAANKINITEDVTEVYMGKDNSTTMTTLDQELNRGNIAGITYYAGMLYSPRAGFFGPHGSTIVGRRFNEESGVCEYLLRNSWGGRCSDYKRFNKDSYPCEDGHLWIPADLIQKHTYSVTRYKE